MDEKPEQERQLQADEQHAYEFPTKPDTTKADHRCARCRIYARTVLWYLAFIGFAINYMIRINLNITIVAMIAPSHAAPNASQPHFTPERWLLDALRLPFARAGFAWDARQQGAVLGSFFWLHWALQIPGGMLARRHGTKFVFGVSNLLGCLLCAALPLAAYLDVRLLLALRVVQGLICGLAWPAMHTLTGRWIPPNERSRFVTAYLGSSIGIAFFYPLFGLVIAVTSWEWVYHLCAAVGTVWWLCWQWLVFDTPGQHPRICPQERQYIERSLGVVGGAATDRQPRTPWRAICTSRPVLIICVAQWGGVWGLFTLMTQAPTYFRTVHGWTVGMTGLLSGLPHLSRMLFALGFSLFGDWLLRSGRMSRTNVRKLAGTFSLLLGAAFVVGLAFAGRNAWLAFGMLMAATAVHGAVSTGPLASLVDLSPNFSGITLGISGMFSVMPGFISAYIVGQLTGDQTSEQWMYVFLLAAAMLAVCGVVYVCLSESELQPWNQPDDRRRRPVDDGHELKAMMASDAEPAKSPTATNKR